jgi:hypothetical protein
MKPVGDGGGGSEPQTRAEVAPAAEELVRAVRAHADAVATADQAAARAAKAVIRSAMGRYSSAIDDAWEEVMPFPLPQTWRQREGLRPRQLHLQVSYELRVCDGDRLMAAAQEVSCEPPSDNAEAAAALYGAQVWVPSGDTGLMYVVATYVGTFKPPSHGA